MADVTVSQFAQVLKVPVDRLIVQLDQAGIKVEGPDGRISDEAKLELLSHLRKSHRSDEQSGSPTKIALKRKTQTELKLASTQGRARTVNVEVRRSRTYVKRDVLEEQNRLNSEDGDSKRREAEEAERRERERLEAERRENERVEAENRRRVEEEQNRKKAQEDARRAAEQQAREDAERREREQQRHVPEQPREQLQKIAPQPKSAPPQKAAPAQRPVAAAVPPPPAADRAQPTRYGREELHVTTDVSNRYKKKRR